MAAELTVKAFRLSLGFQWFNPSGFDISFVIRAYLAFLWWDNHADIMKLFIRNGSFDLFDLSELARSVSKL